MQTKRQRIHLTLKRPVSERRETGLNQWASYGRFSHAKLKQNIP